MKPIVRHLLFPSDKGETTIEVLYQKGDPAFVCGAHGSITGGMIEDIEKDFSDNPDEGFDRGDGIYLYVPRWEIPQVDNEGRIELPGYWDLELVGFKTAEQAMPRTRRLTVTNEAQRNEDTVEPLVRQLLAYINDTPTLLSLLYDLDWMPEQLERGGREWFRMLMLAEAWKANMPNNAARVK